ncbi:MAG: hypothetical protein ACI379_04595 [Nocardioides sp.]|uniref:hypothetical protein n=1 Tax=Nocardioides sp. TaxID=35761 RepID=UPI003F00A18C
MSENTTTPAPSRRSVVRTAAWAVPAVSLVTAAPAFAATGDPVQRGTLDVVYHTGTRVAWATGTASVVVQQLDVRNLGPEPIPAGALTIVVDMPEEWGNSVSWVSGTGNYEGNLDTTRWNMPTFGSNTVTFTSKPGANAMAAGEKIEFLTLAGGSNWAWTTTTRGRGNTIKISAFAGGSDSNGAFYFAPDELGAAVTNVVGLGVWTAGTP